MLFVSACESTGGGRTGLNPAAEQGSPGGTVGTPMQDVRTEVLVQEIEQEYIAAKNSRPTRQHEAEAKKKQEQEQERKAQEQAKKAAEPGP